MRRGAIGFARSLAGTSSPAPAGLMQFRLDQPDDLPGGMLQGLGELEDRGQGWLLLTQLENAYKRPAQVGLEAEGLLRQAGLVP